MLTKEGELDRWVGRELNKESGQRKRVKDRVSKIRVETRREELSVRKMCGNGVNTERDDKL